MKLRSLSLFFVIFIVFSLTSINSSAVIYGDPPETDYPSLDVQKWISKTELKLNETVTVHVNITNFGRAYAENVSILEPKPSAWSLVEYPSHDQYVFIKLGQSGSFYYNYSMQFIQEGSFVIEETVLKYVDMNGTNYVSRSNHIPITVSFEEPPLELDEQWSQVLQLSLLMIAIPVVVLTVRRFIFR